MGTWLDYLFMRYALLGVIIICPLLGLLGTMVVSNRMAFFSDALGHSALTGIALGVLLGLKNPLAAMLAFGLLMAFLITTVKSSRSASTDTIIGVFSSTAVALGVVLLSRGGGFNRYSRYLIGDILAITPGELYLLGGIAVVTIVLWQVYFNPWLLAGINPSLARSRGVNVRGAELGFAALIAVVVTVSIQWVGILIINSLLVLPAAAARNLALNVRQYCGISLTISLVSGLSGLILSYYWSTAAGATIVLVAAVLYFASLLITR